MQVGSLPLDYQYVLRVMVSEKEILNLHACRVKFFFGLVVYVLDAAKANRILPLYVYLYSGR